MVYRSKLKWIGKFVEGKRVLDLGCVCHDLDQTAVPWLHGFLKERAASVLGVDRIAEEVNRMSERGFDAVCADVEEMDLLGGHPGGFDVIVAGDIIEHLDNPGRFLDRVREHLAPNGVFLVTTPNPVTYVRFMRLLFKGSAGGNREHTCWFTTKVLLQLAHRHNMELAEEAYADETRLYYPWFKPAKKGGPIRRFFHHLGRFLGMLLFWKPVVWTNSLVCLFRPRCAETICMAFRAYEKPESAE
jgi:SAM-dependent methyltransferase